MRVCLQVSEAFAAQPASYGWVGILMGFCFSQLRTRDGRPAVPTEERRRAVSTDKLIRGCECLVCGVARSRARLHGHVRSGLVPLAPFGSQASAIDHAGSMIS